MTDPQRRDSARSSAGGPPPPGPKGRTSSERFRTVHGTDEASFIEASDLDAHALGKHDMAQMVGGEGGAAQEAVSFGKRAREEAEMDMTPMVDCVFQLLIFFMVTAAFSLQKSQNIPTPKPDEPSTNVIVMDPQEDPNTVTVRVDEFNTYHVLTNEWEAEAPSDHELLVKLREARQGDSQGHRPTKLLVMANGEAMHEKVVTAVDAGTEVGMDEVQLMTVEDDTN